MQQERYYQSIMKMNREANQKEDLKDQVQELAERVKKLEEEITWRSKEQTLHPFDYVL